MKSFRLLTSISPSATLRSATLITLDMLRTQPKTIEENRDLEHYLKLIIETHADADIVCAAYKAQLAFLRHLGNQKQFPLASYTALLESPNIIRLVKEGKLEISFLLTYLIASLLQMDKAGKEKEDFYNYLLTFVNQLISGKFNEITIILKTEDLREAVCLLVFFKNIVAFQELVEKYFDTSHFNLDDLGLWIRLLGKGNDLSLMYLMGLCILDTKKAPLKLLHRAYIRQFNQDAALLGSTPALNPSDSLLKQFVLFYDMGLPQNQELAGACNIVRHGADGQYNSADYNFSFNPSCLALIESLYAAVVRHANINDIVKHILDIQVKKGTSFNNFEIAGLIVLCNHHASSANCDLETKQLILRAANIYYDLYTVEPIFLSKSRFHEVFFNLIKTEKSVENRLKLFQLFFELLHASFKKSLERASAEPKKISKTLAGLLEKLCEKDEDCSQIIDFINNITVYIPPEHLADFQEIISAYTLYKQLSDKAPLDSTFQSTISLPLSQKLALQVFTKQFSSQPTGEFYSSCIPVFNMYLETSLPAEDFKFGMLSIRFYKRNSVHSGVSTEVLKQLHQLMGDDLDKFLDDLSSNPYWDTFIKNYKLVNLSLLTNFQALYKKHKDHITPSQVFLLCWFMQSCLDKNSDLIYPTSMMMKNCLDSGINEQFLKEMLYTLSFWLDIQFEDFVYSPRLKYIHDLIKHQFDFFPTLLPELIVHQVGAHLDLQMTSRLAQTSTKMHGLFQHQLSKDVSQLLMLIVQGKQVAVKVLITKDPSLLLCKGKVSDRAGRVFADIYPLQYTVWALDRHMFNLIMEFLPKEQAAKQLKEHFSGKPFYTQQHGLWFPYQDTIDAYEALNKYSQVATSDILFEILLRGIFHCQCGWPAHIYAEMLFPGRSFTNRLNLFNEAELPRVYTDLPSRSRNGYDLILARQGTSEPIEFRSIEDFLKNLSVLKSNLMPLKKLFSIRKKEIEARAKELLTQEQMVVCKR